MRILIDIGHPADVHLFRCFYLEMIQRNHQILFTARNKDVTYRLLEAYQLKYIPYGHNYKNILWKIIGMFKFDYQLFMIARKFKPELFLSHGSFYASHIAFLLRKPFITFEDTGNLEQIFLYKYFSSVILTPSTFTINLGNRHIRFNGTKELAYLHPKYFTPDIHVLNDLGIEAGERFVLLRFVSWNASHDFGHSGISYLNKIRLIEKLSEKVKVFISSETTLPEEFSHLRIQLAPEKILSVMYYADLMYGESATMASECAVMGTPAIFVNNANISYTQEQETKYDLVFNFTESEEDQEKSIKKALELLQLPDLKSLWRTKRLKLIEDSIDLTAFLVWFIENYPESKIKMKECPGFQLNFK